jgi:hypothetical protein
MKTSDSRKILITINWWLADENDHIETENFIQASPFQFLTNKELKWTWNIDSAKDFVILDCRKHVQMSLR